MPYKALCDAPSLVVHDTTTDSLSHLRPTPEEFRVSRTTACKRMARNDASSRKGASAG